MKFNKNIIKPKVKNEIEIVVVDVDGKLIENIKINLKLSKVETKQKGYTYVEEEKEMLNKDLISEKDKPIIFDLNIDNGGYYKLELSIKDQFGGENKTCKSFMVEGAKTLTRLSEIKNITKDTFILMADKELYNIGDVANILVQSPYPDDECEAIYEILTQSINTINRFKIKNDFNIQIPIKKEFVPNISITVYIVGKEKRIDENTGDILKNVPKRPAYASSSINLQISNLVYGLKVKLQPKKQYSKPADENEVEIEVKDFEEKLLKNSEVTIMVVDEAVLSLTGYSHSDPLAFFHTQNYCYTQDYSSRSIVLVKDYSEIKIEGIFFIFF
jgi:alpha-2-macroglobulin